MKSHLIKIQPWNRKLLLIISGDKPFILSEISKHKMGRSLRTEICAETPTKNDAAVTYWDDDGRYILWFPNNKVSNQTIVHETNHIVKLMMKYIGAQQENEGHAYTQDWLFKEIRRLLKL